MSREKLTEEAQQSFEEAMDLVAEAFFKVYQQGIRDGARDFVDYVKAQAQLDRDESQHDDSVTKMSGRLPEGSVLV